MATARFSLTLFLPMTPASRLGRSFSSNDASSSTTWAETMRSRTSGELFGVDTVADGTPKMGRSRSAGFPQQQLSISRLHLSRHGHLTSLALSSGIPLSTQPELTEKKETE